MRWVRWAVDNLVEVVAMAMLLLLVFLTLFGVLSRYVLPVPISFTEELGRFLFIWISFLGAAIVMKRDEHIRLDLFQGFVSARALAVVRIFVFTCIAFLSVAMLITAPRLLSVAARQTAAVSRISMGTIYLILPLSAALTLAYALWHLGHTVAGLRGGR